MTLEEKKWWFGVITTILFIAGGIIAIVFYNVTLQEAWEFCLARGREIGEIFK